MVQEELLMLLMIVFPKALLSLLLTPPAGAWPLGGQGDHETSNSEPNKVQVLVSNIRDIAF